ncbi:tRNA (cytidine/uridine-2'-O-)-methyltransferase [Roseibium hamelinense]|uniref:tRNA (cytidine(34)-2'-O)-methyltransferase n=1 Tax=Roseibium hamelinense TaxID=150831 RepID=A0A562SXV0_9HYPH|nr:tRNA (cytidine(34)-2'-O)-methyltransferase [Roseibium hamelinense]MTI43596.1 tRNA (cytidine(34)-2'-O)-methyltransferase [Roseibium hamelinense]TWI86111.1 tRNA (cytidine/uridine-2'-O-)-methyltransferase [Roseibium hamelinense]
MPDIALYQPDIPQNTGTILRMAACMGVTVRVIEPAGFPLSDHALKRAGMDYLERAAMIRHVSYDNFQDWCRESGRRLVLMTTKGSVSYNGFQFEADDILLFGRESVGVPDTVQEDADKRVKIPMTPGMRSLNVAVSAAMILGEALRQTNLFPPMAGEAC